MKKLLLFFASVIFICSGFYLKPMMYTTEWTILVYMQGDNNLSSYMQKDIDEMMKGLTKAAINTDDRVNILVQMDLPSDNKTWRFRVERTGKIEDESVNQEMGINPEKELVATASWIKAKYSANHYFWILSGHGSGSDDYRSILTSDGSFKFTTSWLEIPGCPTIKASDLYNSSNKAKTKKEEVQKNNGNDKKVVDKKDKATGKGPDRGILYDDSQETCLTNQAMTNAFTQIRDILKPGRKLEILGMDACLMGMLEVVYQIKDCFEYFVGSQQVEAGTGWDYTGFIGPLSQEAENIGAEILAKMTVDSYGLCYSPGRDQTFTLAAYDLSAIEALKINIDSFVDLADTCLKYQSYTFKNAVIAARQRTVSFDNTNYIDLYSFFREMGKEVVKLLSAAENYTPTCWGSKMSPNYIAALKGMATVIENSMQLIYANVVIRNTCGRNFVNGTDVNANGISIYYPSPKNSILSIHRTYYDTLYAQNSKWLNFIRKYRTL